MAPIDGFPFGRLRATLARFEGTPGQSLEANEKAIVSERPANALRDAQAGEQPASGSPSSRSAKRGKPVPDGFQRVTPSSLLRKCARVLDHRQSCARPTSRART
jgi:hypothetical protein